MRPRSVPDSVGRLSSSQVVTRRVTILLNRGRHQVLTHRRKATASRSPTKRCSQTRCQVAHQPITFTALDARRGCSSSTISRPIVVCPLHLDIHRGARHSHAHCSVCRQCDHTPPSVLRIASRQVLFLIFLFIISHSPRDRLSGKPVNQTVSGRSCIIVTHVSEAEAKRRRPGVTGRPRASAGSWPSPDSPRQDHRAYKTKGDKCLTGQIPSQSVHT